MKIFFQKSIKLQNNKDLLWIEFFLQISSKHCRKYFGTGNIHMIISPLWFYRRNMGFLISGTVRNNYSNYVSAKILLIKRIFLWLSMSKNSLFTYNQIFLFWYREISACILLTPSNVVKEYFSFFLKCYFLYVYSVTCPQLMKLPIINMLCNSCKIAVSKEIIQPLTTFSGGVLFSSLFIQ